MKSTLDNILDSDRYAVIPDALLGQGNWGIVYDGRDKETGKPVAIKVSHPSAIAQAQMVTRELTEEESMRKEGVELEAMGHVVARKYERDKQGRPFIVMKKYEESLDQTLQEEGDRLHLNTGLSFIDFKQYTLDIAKGIGEIHTVLKKAHGDLILKNILKHFDGYAHITDFGNLTYYVEDKKSNSPRDNVGVKYIRAPELFKEGSHATPQSDVWSYGSLVFRMLTGEYIFEKELNQFDGTEAAFMQYITQDKKAYKKTIRKKLKEAGIQRGLRKVLEKCLAPEDERLANGVEVVPLMEYVLNEQEKPVWKKKITQRIGTYALAAGVVLTSLVGVDNYMDAKAAQEEVIDANASKERNNKMKAVRFYQMDASSSHLDVGEDYQKKKVKAYVTFFGDEQLGMAAYLNHAVVYEAMQIAGSKKYEDILPVIEKLDNGLFMELTYGLKTSWDVSIKANTGVSAIVREVEQEQKQIELDYQLRKQADSLRNTDTTKQVIPSLGSVAITPDSSHYSTSH